MNSTKPRISCITIGRLYNLGSYEHVRYELTVEIPETVSASMTLTGIERLFAALNPRPPGGVDSKAEIEREQRRLERMKADAAKDPERFDRDYHYVGTREEYFARCEATIAESVRKRQEWEARSKKAREMLDGLGGLEHWRDAKLEWDDDDYFG